MLRQTILLFLLVTGLAVATPAMLHAQESDTADTVLSERAVPAAQAPAGAQAAPSEAVPIFLIIPFALLLLMIATGPLLYPHHWHRHYQKYAVGLGLVVAIFYFVAVEHGGEAVLHSLTEYISFIALLAALFVASGGIFIETSFDGEPHINVTLLAVGAVLANIIGTTGASMLLIRPYMRLNAGRLRAYHIVFFIFVVSNIGGALTPIGDPPLFLGFLRGVPFFWTLKHIWYIWAPVLLLILGVFYVIDKRNRVLSIRDVVPDEALPESTPTSPPLSPAVPHGKKVRITGMKSFGWLALIIVAVFVDPKVDGMAWVPDLHAFYLPLGIREVILLSVCVLAYFTADKRAHQGNNFNLAPIEEVGWLFIGIFLTMIPALGLIERMAAENAHALGASHFYFGTGALSSVLDNAPTYLSFLSAALGKFAQSPEMLAIFGSASDITVANPAAVHALAVENIGPAVGWHYVQAISVAAVFFGAMTYIGNGPNFMVKAIAESSGAECPSFVSYTVRYAIPVLLPIFVLVWVFFFSGWVFPLS